MSTAARAAEAARPASVECVPLSPLLGAEVRGVDLGRPIDDGTAEAIRQALWTHKVIVVRGQEVSPAGFIRFARALGPLEPFFISAYSHPEHPEIYVLSNVRRDGKPIGRDGAGTHWHSDHTFQPRPASVTLLHGVEVPDEGGDTLFVDMVDAYERLPDGMKRRLDGLRAIHHYQKKEFVFTGDRAVGAAEAEKIRRLQAQRAAEEAASAPSPTAQKSNRHPDQHHPVVRVHPVTGRKAIYLNDEMTVGMVGMAEGEGRALLRELCEHATPPDRIFRFRWRKGDVVAWDNAAVMHTATYTDPARPRIMHRLTIEGTVPV